MLMRSPPSGRDVRCSSGGPPGDEMRIAAALFAIAQAVARQRLDAAPRGLENGLARGGVPLPGGAEARVEIGLARRHETELYRAFPHPARRLPPCCDANHELGL